MNKNENRLLVVTTFISLMGGLIVFNITRETELYFIGTIIGLILTIFIPGVSILMMIALPDESNGGKE